MSNTLLLCVIPSERVELVSSITAAGGVPVVDMVHSTSVSVPDGAWVRVRSLTEVPGRGPVILAGGDASETLADRECWIELTEPGPTPDGFAGVVLRGNEAGGACGSEPGLDLLGRMPVDSRVILAASILPADVAAVVDGGAEGVIISDPLSAEIMHRREVHH